jgi:predicted MFS family arabinose efflux permease
VITASLSWWWVLFVNLPVCAAVLAGASRFAVESKPPPFGRKEARSKSPLVPLAIFRIRGLPAADATQVIAMAGFYSVFFFLTLYMQNVLGFSPTRAGLAYVPVAGMVAVSAGASTRGEPSSEITGIAVADSAGRVNARNGRIEAGGKS